MEVEANYTFDAPTQRVWEVLLDPEVLARCMPGCEKLVPLGDDQYEATMSVGVGSIKGSYVAKITLADLQPVRSYRLVIEGTGSPGFVRGQALVSLEDRGDTTLVKVEGDAQVGGTIARFGQRLIGTVYKNMMDRIFTCLQSEAGRPRSSTPSQDTA